MIFKHLLWPFALIYGMIIKLRNYLFDIGYTRSFKFDVKTIGVGNLSVGGTGKSPAVEYLIKQFVNSERIATLSRGYGRKTRGFLLANDLSKAEDIGDEPLQFYSKYRNRICVAVDEERIHGIPEILFDKPETSLILLDDVYQHRYVSPDFMILLTTYDKPFFNDHLLPVGRLREQKNGAKRADVVLVTKSPIEISSSIQLEYKNKIKSYAGDETPVYFTKIGYASPVDEDYNEIELDNKVVLVSGLADPSQLKTHLSSQISIVKHFDYPDHYNFKDSDFKEWVDFCKDERINQIIVSEKDWMRIKSMVNGSEITSLKFVIQPISMVFLNEKDENSFIDLVNKKLSQSK
ncbi:tetraacyldisaccharide 4'-kinase [Marinigracilibium pacificum]|uniref:Tetraacyldisaccharide 4'-kinase n=1 Tax=Marinigracilibium pacificum TaxID=2729599 RepID=A0A848IXF3_9BACT|nr:tetraacyldisaccharide 4'-kinase [Marinigracilibium pacificum]NMM47965.1 tetraacyldisaccharide 4'-kinase [Marinigracilibium pacificum]